MIQVNETSRLTQSMKKNTNNDRRARAGARQKAVNGHRQTLSRSRAARKGTGGKTKPPRKDGDAARAARARFQVRKKTEEVLKAGVVSGVFRVVHEKLKDGDVLQSLSLPRINDVVREVLKQYGYAVRF